MEKTTLILLVLCTVSALYMVDKRTEIRYETNRYGNEQKRAIRLEQDYAGLLYEYSQVTDLHHIKETAKALKMFDPEQVKHQE